MRRVPPRRAPKPDSPPARQSSSGESEQPGGKSEQLGEPAQPRASRSRLARLQVALLVAFGLWSIDSGMGGLSFSDASDAPGSLPAVSSAPMTDAVRSPHADGSGAASDHPDSPDVAALTRLLASVNPTLAPSELSRIASAVMRYSAKYELDPELVTAVLLVESTARPWVRSPKGAVGLMQVMPHMMEPLGLAGNAATIESNIEAGCFILASNIRRLGEDAGISAYFWGSEIRGAAYLEKVQAARAEVRRFRRS